MYLFRFFFGLRNEKIFSPAALKYVALKHGDRHNKITLSEQQYTRAVIISTCDLTTLLENS